MTCDSDLAQGYADGNFFADESDRDVIPHISNVHAVLNKAN